ncbi:MAG: PocR ligand-binding domain-containing protein [Opitutaceae bacterium]|nr:PocR ligand-binding domain-containing protein [Opitutaceae bacterium]
MTAPSESAQRSREFVDKLKRSQIYRDYEQAFRDTTGLPINLRSLEAFDLPHHHDPNENPFCSLMAKSNKSCAACLQLQRRVEEEAGLKPTTLKCFAGLCDSSVPVRVGDNLVAFLQTGQVFLEKPDSKLFAKTAKQIISFGTEVDMKRVEEAWFQSRVLDRRQYDSILRLLSIFAQHLSALGQELAIQAEHGEAPPIARARALIASRHGEDIGLEEVAKAVNMSSFYFCKSFKKATGMTFTNYLARVRVEKVKSLLINPHKRVSEAAFEAGFQSLSQFNRVFRRIAGQSPKIYCEQLRKRLAPVR